MEANHAASDGIWMQDRQEGHGRATCVARRSARRSRCASAGSTASARRSTTTYFLQKYTPRRARSKWSKINVGKVEALIERGADAPGGPRRDRAREGRRPLGGRLRLAARTIEVPPDLQAELDRDPARGGVFAALNSQNRYAILYRLHDAKKPETRARRLAQFVEMLASGETLH